MEIGALKPTTLSHYEQLTLAAAQRVAAGLDEALDPQALASPACMAPLHFHRVFRGLLGETPLQLHRRLRMERAAWRLAQQDDPVLQIALDAGFETHEAFTRAFRDAFGRSPTEHRVVCRQASAAATRPPACRLQAACGIHADGPLVAFPADPATLFIHQGALTMNVQIQSRPDLRVAALTHIGPYNTIHLAFERLSGIAGPAGLLNAPDARMIAIYHDDPESVPAGQLRSAAGVTVAPAAVVPLGLQALALPAGRWACATHRGSYSGLGDAWQRFLGQWLPASGHRLGPGDCYELYENHPGNAREPDLLTLLYAPLAD